MPALFPVVVVAIYFFLRMFYHWAVAPHSFSARLLGLIALFGWGPIGWLFYFFLAYRKQERQRTIRESMDRIILRDIVCQANAGVSEQERATKQTVIVEAELVLDLKPAGTKDDLAMSVDYVAIEQAVKKSVEGRSYQLLETLLEAAAKALFEAFAITQVVVRVRKRDLMGPNGPLHATVEITRNRDA